MSPLLPDRGYLTMLELTMLDNVQLAPTPVNGPMSAVPPHSRGGWNQEAEHDVERSGRA